MRDPNSAVDIPRAWRASRRLCSDEGAENYVAFEKIREVRNGIRADCNVAVRDGIACGGERLALQRAGCRALLGGTGGAPVATWIG